MRPLARVLVAFLVVLILTSVWAQGRGCFRRRAAEGFTDPSDMFTEDNEPLHATFREYVEAVYRKDDAGAADKYAELGCAVGASTPMCHLASLIEALRRGNKAQLEEATVTFAEFSNGYCADTPENTEFCVFFRAMNEKWERLAAGWDRDDVLETVGLLGMVCLNKRFSQEYRDTILPLLKDDPSMEGKACYQIREICDGISRVVEETDPESPVGLEARAVHKEIAGNVCADTANAPFDVMSMDAALA